ncbi:hypothetical protein BG841_05200 [Marinobacter sp. X15-166B]|nr:hypothetical protein BG841_05200 [Marinobacter sp. X15-166B]
MHTRHNRTEVIRHDRHLTVANDRFSQIKANSHTTVKGDKWAQTGKNHSFQVTGSLHLRAGTAWLSKSGGELHIKAGHKVVIEAGAEIILQAAGSFVKIDPGGVAMGGPTIRLNAGGTAGRGSGPQTEVPERPGTVDKSGVVSTGEVAPSPGATRPLATADQIRALKNAAQQGKGLCELCPDTTAGTTS